MSTYQQLGTQIGALVEKKNAAYGSSFEKSGEFLRLLFPAGVPADRAEDALLLVRMFDKQMRIATDQDAFGESPYMDIAGYGLLGARMHSERKSNGCGFVSDTSAAEELRAQDNSAAPSAAPQITPTASEPSVSNSEKPSSSPSQPTFASTAAPAPSATASAFASVAALLGQARGRNARLLCGTCEAPTTCDEVACGPTIGDLYFFCDTICVEVFDERLKILSAEAS